MAKLIDVVNQLPVPIQDMDISAALFIVCPAETGEVSVLRYNTDQELAKDIIKRLADGYNSDVFTPIDIPENNNG